MALKTIDHLIDWLLEYAIKNKAKYISVYFYGGEPTMSPDKIRYFCQQSYTKFIKKNIAIEYNMYTNGTLLKDNLFSTIIEYRFNNLQITLDGPPENHNKRRPFKDGRDSFNVIYKNIMRILDNTGSHITLLMNFDKYNYKKVDKLLRLFHNYSDHKNFELVFNPLFATKDNRNYCNIHSFSTDKESSRVWAYLYKRAIKKGVNCNPLRIFDTGPCSFYRASNIVFDTQGNIYNCIGFLGDLNLSVGSIYDSLDNKVILNFIDQINIAPWDNEKCTKCQYLPLCIGGCRFHSLVSTENIIETYCHKDLIENCELELIKYMYKNNIL